MLEIKELTKTYNLEKPNAFEALHGISLTINEGELVAIIGTSGAGKSTLLHILACIDDFEAGDYILDGVSLKKASEDKMALIRNEKIGMIMQDFALVDDFTAEENIMIPLDFAKKQKRKSKKEKVEKVMSALESVGMQQFMKKKVKNLSGGQKQRVAIARAIVNEPAIILADEPTGALDSKTTQEIMALFKELNEAGRTIIIVTHDMDVANNCDRIIAIEDGKISKDEYKK